MSMDLKVVAAPPDADEAAARALLKACSGPSEHVEGDIDDRIIGFYEDLRAVYPDHDYGDDCPWSGMPLGTGIDHVFMNIRWSADPAVIELIHHLATTHRLVLYDPQDDSVDLPPANLSEAPR